MLSVIAKTVRPGQASRRLVGFIKAFVGNRGGLVERIGLGNTLPGRRRCSRGITVLSTTVCGYCWCRRQSFWMLPRLSWILMTRNSSRRSSGTLVIASPPWFCRQQIVGESSRWRVFLRDTTRCSSSVLHADKVLIARVNGVGQLVILVVAKLRQPSRVPSR